MRWNNLDFVKQMADFTFCQGFTLKEILDSQGWTQADEVV